MILRELIMETPVNAPFKEKMRLEIVKLREMSFKEKLEYIWEYYKYHIIGLIVAILIIVSVLNAWVFNPSPDSALFIAWSSGFATEEQFDIMTDLLRERIVDEDVNEEVIISQFFFYSDDPSINMGTIQRTAAMIAAGMIDLFIVDTDQMEEFAQVGYLRPLEDILEEIKSKNPEVYSRIEDNKVIATFHFHDGRTVEHVAGIMVGESPLFIKLGIFRQELFASVSITSENLENIVEALIVLFE